MNQEETNAQTSESVFYSSRQQTVNVMQTGSADNTEATTPSATRNDKPVGIRFVKAYMFSVYGLIRVLLIIALLGAWIAGAAIEKDRNQMKAFTGAKNTRLCYIIITIIAFVISILIYLFNLFNIVNMFPLNRFNSDLMFVFIDGLFFIPIAVLGAICTWREAIYGPKYSLAVRKGSFGAAAFFAFFAALLYGLNCGLQVLKRSRGRSQRISN